MKTKIMILSDNYVGKTGLIGEHGFCALIQQREEKYLFDTGAGRSLQYNLEKLNIDISGIKKIFLSHGHYDHTGGLKWIVQQLKSVEIFAHPDLFVPHMALNRDDKTKPPHHVGCPFLKNELEQLGACFNFVEGTKEIMPGIWFINNIDRRTEYQPFDPKLVIEKDGHLISDQITDDASLLIETETFPALIMGCAHSGILNILRHVENQMKIRKLSAIIGGTHLKFSSNFKMPQVIACLEKFEVDLIATSHCTGFKASALLLEHYKDRFKMASVGSIFNI